MVDTNNHKINKIIPTIILIIIILIILVIVLMLYFNSRKNINKITGTDRTSPEETEVDTVLEECQVPNKYFIVKDIIKEYSFSSGKLNIQAKDIEVYREDIGQEELKKYKEEKAKEEEQLASEKIYYMLDNSYVNEFNIKKEDLKEKFNMDSQTEIIINKMYSVENSNNVSTYFVTGKFVNTINSKVEDFNIAVAIDMLNNTFAIYPEEYLKKHNYDKLELGQKLDMPIESINKNDYNTFEYKVYIDDSEIAKEYFNNYKYAMLYDMEDAYNMLNKEYREKRFESMDAYKLYVNENYNDLSKCVVSKYQVTEENDKKEYVCMDNFGNYYVFLQNNISNYELQLDTYTIQNEAFLKKYNNGDEKTKAGINTEGFFEALNRKDYKYIYNHLADSFKNNYFKSEDALKEYFKQNLFVYVDTEYEDYKKEGNINIFKVKVSNKENSDEEVEMTVLVQLRENNDFIISFSLE